MRLLLLEPLNNFDPSNVSLSPFDPIDLLLLRVLQAACQDPEQATFRCEESLAFPTAARLLILQFKQLPPEATDACLPDPGGLFLRRRTRARAEHGQGERRAGQPERPSGPAPDARPGSDVPGAPERDADQADRGAEVSVIGAE